MFFIILPNKKVIKFFSCIILIDLLKYFCDYFFFYLLKVDGFFVKSCFLLEKNSIVKFYENVDRYCSYFASNYCRLLMSNSVKIFLPFSSFGTGLSHENIFFYDFEFDFKLSSNFLIWF